MLHTIISEVLITHDNFGATITDAGIGTSATSGGSTHQKGTAVTLISGANVTEDVYGIGIMFAGGNGSNSIRRYLADLLIDPEGGTSWKVLINNLFVNNASLIQGGYNYYFPLYVKAGTSFGFQQQCNLATTALRCAIQLYGKPNRPELTRVGTKVETFGAVLSTTSGTAITPGTSAVGAYAQLGTTSFEQWWWQWGGIGYNESVFTANGVIGDVACGDATNKKICVDNCIQSYTGAEQAGKSALGFKPCYRIIRAGELVYARAACTAAPETTPTTTAYGLG